MYSQSYHSSLIIVPAGHVDKQAEINSLFIYFIARQHAMHAQRDIVLPIPSVRPSVHLSQSWSWVTFSKPNPTQNFWNRPNPQKSSPDPTQPIIDTWYGILVIPKTLYNNCYMSQTSSQIKISKQSRTYPIFSLLTLHSSLHPTQPNPPKIKKNSDPTQPNPWMDPTHDQL